MMQYLYRNWAKMGMLLALYSLVFLFSFASSLTWPLFWIWLQFPIYVIHEFEEHAYPGGFKDFVNREIFHQKQNDFPLNDADIFWINIPAVWILFPVVAILAQHIDPKIGLILPFFGLFNATTHILVFAVKRKYNPGLLASAFLNYPLGIYTLIVFYQNQMLDWEVSLYSIGFALIAHLMIVLFAALKFRKTLH